MVGQKIGYFVADWPLLDQLVAGIAAGGTSTSILHPLDLLKTRFQATTTNEYRQLFSVPRQLVAIYKSSNLRGLYRGFSANLAGSTTSWGLYFLLYNWIQGKWDGELVGWQYFVSSGTAGMLTAIAANPLWLSKTRLCQVNSKYTGLLNCLRTTYRDEGFRGLYRGMIPGLLGTSHGAVQFLVYEELKQWHRRRFNNQRPTLTEYLGMSSTSKIVASLVTYPYQLVRCRMQISPLEGGHPYTSVMDVIRRTWRYEGFLGFYRGIAPTTIRVLPGTCITFLVYERAIGYFGDHAGGI
jgi:solute carrier family 25 folate transporter 32